MLPPEPDSPEPASDGSRLSEPVQAIEKDSPRINQNLAIAGEGMMQKFSRIATRDAQVGLVLAGSMRQKIDEDRRIP